MSCYLITVQNGRKAARRVCTAAEYKALRGTPQQMQSLQRARQGDAQAKLHLVQFNYSGHYPDGLVKGNKLPSGAFGFDIDDREEFARVKALLLTAQGQLTALGQSMGLLMLEHSVSQGGHAVFARQWGQTILENQVRVASQLGCEMDTNTHDINRVYFSTSASANDLLYLSETLFADTYDEVRTHEEADRLAHRETYHMEVLPEGAHKANKHFKPSAPVAHDKAPAEVKAVPAAQPAAQPPTGDETYLGIPYALIIDKWWELYNDGQTPVKSNRDVLTFELAVNLRHICGFDRELMQKVIPCYDGFPHEQKMKCIDSALSEKRTQMPKRLKDVLFDLRKHPATVTSEADFQMALDAALAEDEQYYYKRLPKLPQGVKESVEAVGPTLSMPVVTAICPCIGTLASGVRLDVHGKKNGLNLIAYIAGDFASGKGSIDPVIDAWMAELHAQDKLYQMQEDEWRAKKRAAKNKKEQPEEPKLPVRLLTLNNTVANLAERLANTEGKHAFSFTPEADTVAQKWKSTMSDFSVMLRQAYDATSYQREARSADAVNVHIDHLYWNVTLCGTPDALYRVVCNYTDGFQSRIAVARTPDNTFSPLEATPYILTDRLADKIQQVAHLLPLMKGEVLLSKLEARGRKWLEEIRLQTMKNDDKVMARQRFRVCVTAQRMVCCLMLCRVCEQLIGKHGLTGAETLLKQHQDLWREMLLKAQTTQMLDAYDVIADSLLDNALFFFRDRIENAFHSRDYAGTTMMGERKQVGRNDSIFERLDLSFTHEQALQQSIAVKGASVSRNAVKQMLKNWKKQGLITQCPDGCFKKLT